MESSRNPIGDRTGDYAGLNQPDDVWFLAGTFGRRAQLSRLVRLAVVPVAALASLAGCDRFSHGCTQVGGDSGVLFFNIAQVLPDNAGGATYRVRACADDACAEWEGSRSDLPSGAGAGDQIKDIQARLPDVAPPGRITAALTVTVVDTGETILDGSTEVDLRRHVPNGEGCPPALFQALVQVTPDGDLEPYSYPQS